MADHCQKTFISVLLPVRISVGPLVKMTLVQLPGGVTGVLVGGTGVFVGVLVGFLPAAAGAFGVRAALIAEPAKG